MSDRTATLTFLAKDAVSGVVKDINSHLGKMGDHAAGAGRALGGMAVTLGKVAATGAAVGIAALGAGFAYAAKEAVEEEKNIARLNAAITANQMTHEDAAAAIVEAQEAIVRTRERIADAEKLGTKGTKEQTAAAEAMELNLKDLARATEIYNNTLSDQTDEMNAAIVVGEKLAFSDDEQRAAIARLITSTHDKKKAYELDALAMDFARLKGIDLATAANIVGKVYDGNTAILNRYGIAVAKGTSSTDALAMMQAAAAGQAEAYGKTVAGSWESFQILIGDVVEDVGSTLLPVLQRMAVYLTDTLVPAVAGIAAKFTDWATQNQPLIDQVGTFVSRTLTDLVTYVMGTVVPAFGEFIGKAAELVTKIVADVGPTVVGIGEKLGALVEIIVGKIVPALMDFAQRVWEGGLNKAVKVAAELVGSVVEWLVKLAAWITSNETIMAALRTAADLIGAAFGFIADGIEALMDWLGQLGDWITGNKPLMAGLQSVAEGISKAFETATGWVRDFFAGLEAVGRWLDQNANVVAFLEGHHGAQTLNTVLGGTIDVPGKASGGWVGMSGPEIIRVGERGPEFITPNNRLGGASLTLAPGAIVVNGSGDPEAVARSVMLALKRETSRQGMSL